MPLLFLSTAFGRDLPAFAEMVSAQADVVVSISASRITEAKAPFLQREPLHSSPGWLGKLLPEDKNAPEDDDRSFGSGFVIGADGYILTNAHVVEGADDIRVRFSDEREFQARVLGRDLRTDIALLKVDEKGLRVARLGSVQRLKVGDWVLAIGSPFGFDSSATAGIVSAKGRLLPDESLVPFIQTDVAINPGNSGGPLFNVRGEVVGINSQIYSRTGGFMGVSFAIPIDVAMSVQAQLRSQGRVVRGRIGVMVQDMTSDMFASFGLERSQGALVSEVESGSGAAAAGIIPGDVIVRFQGQTVFRSTDLPRIVSATVPGEKVELHLWREGRLKVLSVRVSVLPEEHAEVAARALPKSLPREANKLGLVLQEPSLLAYLNVSDKRGLVVRDVYGEAARAGVRPGDVILAWVKTGQRISLKTVDEFNRVVNALRPGTGVTLLVKRGDVQSFVAIKAL